MVRPPCGSRPVRLATEQAPAAPVPQRFTSLALAWGMVAGAWLVWHGEALLASRWAPDTVALVHIWTLGVFGNAMLGSLWQFLPVAAGVAVPGASAAWAAMTVFNLGAALLVVGFVLSSKVLLAIGGVSAIGVLVPAGGWLLLAGCRRNGASAVARLLALPGVVLVLAMGLAGLMLAQRLGGRLDGTYLRLVDAHAALAVLGWVLGLVWVVGSVVGPMFQSLCVPRPAVLGRVLAGMLALLLLAAGAWVAAATAWPLRAWVGAALLVSALAYLGALARARHGRNLPLKAAWAMAAACLGVAAATAFRGSAVTAAAWVLAGVWLVLTAMLVEIRSFLAWLELQRRCGRGVRLPGIHALWPDRSKWQGLALHACAALATALAAGHPEALARPAGALTVAAFGLGMWQLFQLRARCADFLSRNNMELT